MSLHPIPLALCESSPIHRTRAALRARRSADRLATQHLIWPLFVQEGVDQMTPIASMPGCARVSVDRALEQVAEAACAGLAGIALFPVVPDHLKDPRGQESRNRDGLMARAIRALKAAAPDLLILSDVALDPYSSDGHDGVVIDGRIDNDATLPLLAEMAVVQAQAGADLVAPSDMMDGRVGVIRRALDGAGYPQVGICSYAVKYASAFYGPFREALESAPRIGDKRTYQMDPGNHREALREIALDEAEGVDWLMVKPGLPYLDIVSLVRSHSALPVAVYHVSGEHAMLRAAAAVGLFSYEEALLESLSAIHRAGADLIVTYGALDAARLLASGPPVFEPKG
ncbi:MAG: porphobilinogen synthase [Nitrospira sp.]|nr:porphobilinogen synthase [Nitrospira sp.]